MSRIIGIAGGPNISGAPPRIPGLHHLFFHDAAAALVIDGAVVHAVEEERLSRQKHTNCFPGEAINSCLRNAALQPSDIDAFAFFFAEGFCDVDLRRVASDAGVAFSSARSLLAESLSAVLKCEVSPDAIKFVEHHHAHSTAAIEASGFGSALSVVVDGNGEENAVTAYDVVDNVHTLIEAVPARHSPGHFYRAATRLLGFNDFDEYKVMGLAPYGDPARFMAALEPTLVKFDELTGLSTTRLYETATRLGLPPRAGAGELKQEHKDFAAAVQALLERVVLTLLKRWRHASGSSKLCLSGGVAQNCAMNGVIARSGLFEEVYVHPASHDAGAAVGAALAIAGKDAKRPSAPFSVFLGRNLSVEGDNDELAALTRWNGAIAWERPDDIHAATAEAIAQNRIVGWARGRAEFGPRALGARSILGDARPRENWQRINLAIKKRESFRPFAPAVLAEYAADYFELPAAACNLGQMNFVVPVRPEWRERLAAVTHVDGTARVQVLRQEDNPDFWRLISAFHATTGIPVLLNTSFNNRYEPIVDRSEDAICTFLTCDLDLLVLGPYLVRKLERMERSLAHARWALAPGASVSLVGDAWGGSHAAIRKGAVSNEVSMAIARGMMESRGRISLADNVDKSAGTMAAISSELASLWEKRLIEPSHD